MLAQGSARQAMAKLTATELPKRWRACFWLHRAVFFLRRKSSQHQQLQYNPSLRRFDSHRAAAAPHKQLRADRATGLVAIFV